MTEIDTPDLFLSYAGVDVYHTFKTDTDVLSTYYYTVEQFNEDAEFDVRDLPVPAGVDPSNHTLIMQAAIDASEGEFMGITTESQEPAVPVFVGIESFDAGYTLDAAEWLAVAPEDQVLALALGDEVCPDPWGGNEGADALFQWLTENHYLAASLKAYIEANPDPEGVDRHICAANGEEAMQWLVTHRPELYWKVMVKQGKAKAITGTVTETIVATRTVTTYSECDEGGVVDQETAEEAIREAAYETNLQDFAHGWDLTSESEPEVEIQDIEAA